MRSRCFASYRVLALTVALGAVFFGGRPSSASIVWNGPLTTFSKADNADPTLAANQDRLTPSVWITRGTTQGLYNAETEISFVHFLSPAGTAWATGTLASYNTLTFSDWDSWATNLGGPPTTIGVNAVMHLLADDVYLSVMLTSWTAQGGGGFSYERSTVPAPASLAVLGLRGLAMTRRRRAWSRPWPRRHKWRIHMKTKRLFLASILGAMTPAISLGQADVLPNIPRGTIAVYLNPIATGLAAPLYGFNPPGDSSRLFVLEQNGLVRLIQNGSLVATPALNIQARVSPPLVPSNANDERGLLGLAFHPGFSDPLSPGFRTLYTYNSEVVGPGVTYAAPNGATQNYRNVVNEWKMSADPNVIDPASRREIISFGKNAANHNGGTITFGPDGYAYLALGDGGNANDVGPSHIEPGGNAQNLSTPLGKMLRFDPLSPALNPGSPDPVSLNGQYRIPVGNPFQGAGQVPEIFAYGFRNPYRFAFDRLNGELIEADVGQNTVEEINRVTIGNNYGWAVKEGDFLFNRVTGPGGAAGTVGARSPGSPAGLTDPITGTLGTLEYDHGDGISITGGFVYRGSAIPELYGKYVFGDLALRTQPVRADGRLFYADLTTGIINEFLLPEFAAGVLPNGLTVHGFGQDESGELYAMTTNTPSNGTGGIVYRLTSCAMTLQGGPLSVLTCSTGAPIFSVTAGGTGPFTYQWQWRPQGTVPWLNIADGVNNDPSTLQPAFTASGSTQAGVTLTSSAGAAAGRREIQVVVTNPCGPSTSDIATWTICPADFDCNGLIQPADVAVFVTIWFTSLQQGTLAGDFDGNGVVNPADIAVFVSTWFNALTNGC